MGTVACYVCPCGRRGHDATRSQDEESQVGDGFSDFLHCWETGRQWFVGWRWSLTQESNVERVQRIIREEEEKDIRLQTGAPKTLERFMRKHRIANPHDLTGDQLATLHHTHGLDREMVEIVLGVFFSAAEKDKYEIALDKHRRNSK